MLSELYVCGIKMKETIPNGSYLSQLPVIKYLQSTDELTFRKPVTFFVGENGAGKSTLMNILGGVLPADSGTICLDGKEVHFTTPLESLDSGVGFIHQELNLINDLTIYENMFLTHLPHKGCLLDKALMRKKTKELFERMNLELDPNTMVRDLDASYKQIVEISRALMQDASIIIMDEPTTSLTEPEIQRVFAMMRTLKEQGVGIIFISHKLGEVMEICDRYTVLRDGCMVAQGLVKDTNSKKLAEYMVGHEIRTESLKRDQNYGDEMLRLENLSDGKHFRDISLSVRAGQVLGITGLLGDGRSELFQTVFGAMGGRYTGKVVIGGKEVHLTDTHQALLEGLAYLPRNRKENAILKDMSILDNGTIVQLPKFVRGLFINKNQQQEAFRIQQEKLRIKMGDKYDLITSLSGGNQQKVVLAKWVMSDPKVLILDNPSQGVDVGAKEEIYSIIHRLAQEGVAIVVLSSEAQEIIRVCDSSLVMYHGRIVGHVSGEDMNEKHIMYLATGGNQSEKEGAM